MDVKMNLRIITKIHQADSKIGSALKIDFRPDWIHGSIPTAWELMSPIWKCIPNLGFFRNKEPWRTNKLRRMLNRRVRKYPAEVIVINKTEHDDDMFLTSYQENFK